MGGRDLGKGGEIAVRGCARIPYFKQYVTKHFYMEILYYFVGMFHITSNSYEMK